MKRKLKILALFCACVLLLCGCAFSEGESEETDGGQTDQTSDISNIDEPGDDDETEETTKADVRYELMGNELIIKCRFEKPVVSDAGNGTVSLIIPGLGNLVNANGTASLPFYTTTLALPQNMTLGKVSATRGEPSVIEGITLKNSGVSPAKERSSGDSDFKVDQGGFKANAFMQEFWGVGVAYVQVYPVYYQPDEKKLTYWQDVTVTLELREELWDLSNLEEEDIEEIKSLVANPEQVDEYIIN